MKVSIIVPVYKTEKYLRQCIDSILAQTYTNLEVILVDDGSPDNCGTICDEYAVKDRRIRVIHKENGGLSDARNAGIDGATGEYLMFVDSDDYIAPEMIEVLFTALKENDADMSLCSFACVDENGIEISESITQSPIKREVVNGHELLKRMVEPFGWYYVLAVIKLYKKDLFRNIRFPRGKIHEDEFIAHHVIGLCKKIACVSEKYYKYVQNGVSITHNRNSLSELHVAEAHIDRASYVEKMGLYDPARVYYMRAAMRIGTNYTEDKNNETITQESRVALELFRKNAYIQKYCSNNERIRAKLICFSPRLYQALQRIKHMIKGTNRQ